jgi:16S rRNA G1207 methylase RsmC
VTITEPATPEEIDRLRQDLRVEADLLGRRLTFATAHGLFSPKAIDAGTQLLLEHVDPPAEDATTFDLGCGYGPIGLAYAAACPVGRVTMVDRDFLAVHYANHNAATNALPHATARLGNGFDGTPAGERFDLIVSNLPAKTGGELLRVMLHDARRHLKPGGRVAVVTVVGLRRFVERHLRAEFGNYKKLKQSTGHCVAMATG